MRKIIRILSISVIVVLVFASCNLFNSTPKLSMSVTGTPDNPRAARSTTGTTGVTTELGGSKIVVTKVEMVILELKLDVDSDNPSSTVEDLEVGPYLFELPLDGTVANLFQGIEVTPALYDELEIQVDAPEGDVVHEGFFTQNHPDWPKTASIRVTGTYQLGNDDPVAFTYTQFGFNEDFEIAFTPALDLINGGANIILAIDVSTWFKNETGLGLLNPSTILPDSAEADQVSQNIEASFEAFEESLED